MASGEIPTDIAKIAGPLIISLLLNAGAYGILCVQVSLYYLAFPKDRWHVKTLVYGVFILETIQSAMYMRSEFKALAYGFLEVSSLDHIGAIWFVIPILGGIVACITQSFYAYRIVVLGQSLAHARPAACVVAVLALAQLGGAITIGIECLQAKEFSRFVDRKVKITTGVWNGGGALCDIIIAMCMTYILTRASKGGIKETRYLLRRLIRLIIETGSLTALIAILNIVLVMLPGEPTYYQVTAVVLSKMYSNTMLVVLNARMNLRHDESKDTSWTSKASIRDRPAKAEHRFRWED